MKIPKKLKVAGVTYRVSVVDDPKTIDGRFEYGTANHMQGEIVLNTATPQEMQEETLLHEVIHCVNERFGLALEEDQVKALGAGLYQILKDNKLLKE